MKQPYLVAAVHKIQKMFLPTCGLHRSICLHFCDILPDSADTIFTDITRMAKEVAYTSLDVLKTLSSEMVVCKIPVISGGLCSDYPPSQSARTPYRTDISNQCKGL